MIITALRRIALSILISALGLIAAGNAAAEPLHPAAPAPAFGLAVYADAPTVPPGFPAYGPPECAPMFESVEERLKPWIDEDRLPPPIKDRYEAFEDWCEGPDD